MKSDYEDYSREKYHFWDRDEIFDKTNLRVFRHEIRTFLNKDKWGKFSRFNNTASCTIEGVKVYSL
ncbi:hypothetical protein GCM10007383_32790 [Arenibacter certesii]|uniref:Uncharacterized protein n=1 Tax=Arenibacter certesii TaxID=228955 RepID=A0A918MP95_9FLAO|nr:hypothetical protein GCM10007383_32790 [Arenibacter certesii]